MVSTQTHENQTRVTKLATALEAALRADDAATARSSLEQLLAADASTPLWWQLLEITSLGPSELHRSLERVIALNPNAFSARVRLGRLRIEELEESQRQYKKTNAALSAQCDEKNQLLNDLHKEHHSLITQLESIRDELAEMVARRDRTAAEMRHLQSQIEPLKIDNAQIQQLSDQFSRLQRQTNEVARARGRLIVEKTQLQKQVTEEKTRLAKLITRYETLKREVADAEETAAQAFRRRDEGLAQLREAARLTEERQKVEQDLRQLQEDLAQQQQLMQDIRGHHETMRMKTKRLQEDITQKEALRNTLDQTLARLTTQVVDLKTEMAGCVSELELIRSTITETTSQQRSLAEEVNDLGAEREIARNELATITVEYKRLLTEVQERTTHSETLAQSLADLTRQVDEAQLALRTASRQSVSALQAAGSDDLLPMVFRELLTPVKGWDGASPVKPSDAQVQKVGAYLHLHEELIDELGSLIRVAYPALHLVWWRALGQSFANSAVYNYFKMQLSAPLDPFGSFGAEELKSLAGENSGAAIKAKEILRRLRRDMNAIAEDDKEKTFG